MAQFVGPRHELHRDAASAPLVLALRGPTPAPAAPDEPAYPADRAWFDSSWELQKGLDVAELQELPADLGGVPPEAA